MDHLVLSIGTQYPRVSPSAWIAPGAVVVGDVQLGPESSVFYGAILRGDCHYIRIGARSNLQDGVVVHVDDEIPTVVGSDVSVGHRAVLHGCTIENGCLIGMSATLMNGVHIGAGSLVAAGALVTPGKRFGSGVLIAGSPAREVRELREDGEAHLVHNAAHYVDLAEQHRAATHPQR